MTHDEFTKELSNAAAAMAKHGRHLEVAPHCHIFTYCRDIAVNAAFRKIISEAWEGISHYFTSIFMVFTITSPSKVLVAPDPARPNEPSGLAKVTVIKMSIWTSDAPEGLYSEIPVRDETNILRDAFTTYYLKIIASGFAPVVFYRQLEAKHKVDAAAEQPEPPVNA